MASVPDERYLQLILISNQLADERVPVKSEVAFIHYVHKVLLVAETHLFAARFLVTERPVRHLTAKVRLACLKTRDHLDQVMCWVGHSATEPLDSKNPGITGSSTIFTALCVTIGALVAYGDYDDLLKSNATQFPCGVALAVSSQPFHTYTTNQVLDAWKTIRQHEYDIPRLSPAASHDSQPSAYEAFVAYREALIVQTACVIVTTSTLEEPFPRHDTTPSETSFNYTRHVSTKDEEASLAAGEYVAKQLVMAGERFIGECSSDAYIACRPWLRPALCTEAFTSRLEEYPDHIVAAALRATCGTREFPSCFWSAGGGVDDPGDLALVKFALDALPALLLEYATPVPGMKRIVTSVANVANCAPKQRTALLYHSRWLGRISGQEAVDALCSDGYRFLYHQVLPGQHLSTAYGAHSMHNMPEGRIAYRFHLWNALVRQCDVNLAPLTNGFFRVGASEGLTRHYIPPTTPDKESGGQYVRVPPANRGGFDASLPSHWEAPHRVSQDRAEIHLLAADVNLVECLGVTYRCPSPDAAFLLWLCVIWSSLRSVLLVPVRNGSTITSYSGVNITPVLSSLSENLCSRAHIAAEMR